MRAVQWIGGLPLAAFVHTYPKKNNEWNERNAAEEKKNALSTLRRCKNVDAK